MKTNKLVKPFLKWAGGKRQLIAEIMKYIPPQYFQEYTYYEPFLGGGALFFELQPKNAVINDSNSELINCYKVIRDSVEELIENLEIHKDNNNEKYYYNIRGIDRTSKIYKSLTPVEKAARIIYLNKTCYNGLFRVNSQGHFNVPFGKYKNPKILDEEVLKAVSQYLNNQEITILNKDFAAALNTAKSGDFIYLDPPYDPVSHTASFTGYDVNKFNKDEQIRLKNLFDELTIRGCKVMLSNSDTEFIRDIYKDYQDKFHVVMATRAINSNALKRGTVKELLIFNYNI